MFTIRIGFGKFHEDNFQDYELEFQLWTWGAALWWNAHGHQRSYQIFHTRARLLGIPRGIISSIDLARDIVEYRTLVRRRARTR